MNQLTCPKCGTKETPTLSWVNKGTSYQMVKATCPRCETYIKFVKITPEILTLVALEPDHKPTSLF
jgi:formate dehydrogenase maturation protein FdhE